MLSNAHAPTATTLQVSSLQGADRACLRQAQQLVQSRVRELGVTLAAAVSAQQHHLTAIGQDVASFAAHARQAAQALGSRLDDVQRGVDQLSGLAGQGLGAAGERAAAAAAQAGEQARALGRGAGEVAGEVGAAAAAAVEALVAALGAQCEALEGMAARRREEAGELERRLAELTAAADAALQGARLLWRFLRSWPGQFVRLGGGGCLEEAWRFGARVLDLHLFGHLGVA